MCTTLPPSYLVDLATAGGWTPRTGPPTTLDLFLGLAAANDSLWTQGQMEARVPTPGRPGVFSTAWVRATPSTNASVACDPFRVGDVATQACAVFTLSALQADLGACKDAHGNPATSPGPVTTYGGLAVASTIVPLVVTRIGVTLDTSGEVAVPGVSIVDVHARTFTVAAAVDLGVSGAAAVWTDASAVDAYVSTALVSASKEPCTQEECWWSQGPVGAPPRFACDCGNVTQEGGGCPASASFARYVLGLVVVMPKDPAGDVGILDTQPFFAPPFGAPYGVDPTLHTSSVSSAPFEGFMNMFKLQVATGCRSEWDTHAGHNSRDAFVSDPACPSCFDVGVHLGRAPTTSPDWNHGPGNPSSPPQPVGPLTLHVRASLRGEVAPTTLVGTQVPMGISALATPVRYPWPGDDPEAPPQVLLRPPVPPLPNDTVAADIVLVVKLANDSSAASMSLYLHSVTACGVNPNSPFLRCLLGMEPGTGPGTWAQPQLPCPSPSLSKNCNATAWASAPEVDAATNPVTGSLPLVRAYLPVTSRGVTRAHLCRLSTRDALQQGGDTPPVLPGSTPEFMCPGRTPVNTTLASAALCGSGTPGSGWQWATLQGVNGTLPGLDALHVPLAALPPGPLAFILTATAAGCNMAPPPEGRRLTGSAAPTRRLSTTASSWDTVVLMLGDGGPGIGTGDTGAIPTVHTTNTTFVIVTHETTDDTGTTNLSIMWPLIVFAILLALVMVCISATQNPACCGGICSFLLLPVKRRRDYQQTNTMDPDQVAEWEPTRPSARPFVPVTSSAIRESRPFVQA